MTTLQKRILTWGCDALLVSNDRDVRYLTGFVGEDSWALILANSQTPYILSDGRFKDLIPDQAPQAISKLKGKHSLSELLKEIIDQEQLNKVAIQADYLRVNERKKIATHIGDDHLLDVEDRLIHQRGIKDESEIQFIRRAIAIQQEAFYRTREYIRPGMTESDIAGYLEHQTRLLGADGMSFPTIVAADANAAIPHHHPGLTKVKEGGILLIDWGARYQGYCSDMTRVLSLGKMPAKIREIYRVVHEAHLAGINAIQPEANQKEIDEAARQVIEKAGFGEHYQHSLGHGIGLDIHEEPHLSFRAEGNLVANQIVTVEPGIYLKGIGGVRLENDILVTAKGPELMCDMPMDESWAVLQPQERVLPAPHYDKGLHKQI